MSGRTAAVLTTLTAAIAGIAGPVMFGGTSVATEVAALPNGAPDIDTAAVKAHLDQFHSIATNQGNGNRCTGSVDYVKTRSRTSTKLPSAGAATRSPTPSGSSPGSNSGMP